jgi:hypothetical protein
MRFLRLVRKMLHSRLFIESTSSREVREFREVLRHICVAHDVLKDPNTRMDYDLRLMGLRANSETPEEQQEQIDAAGGKTSLMIAELLEAANLVAEQELQVALEMHTAEPDTPLGDFLLRAGFVNQEELDATSMAQKFISAGKITVAQYRTAMVNMKEREVPFFDTLMLEGWISPSDILNDTSIVHANEA